MSGFANPDIVPFVRTTPLTENPEYSGYTANGCMMLTMQLTLGRLNWRSGILMNGSLSGGSRNLTTLTSTSADRNGITSAVSASGSKLISYIPQTIVSVL